MPSYREVEPQPAFDMSLLPRAAQITETTTGGGGGFPVSKGQRAHYRPEYLDGLHPLEQKVNALYDLLGWAAQLAAMLGSWLVAFFNPLWVFDSVMLNMGAFMDNAEQTMFLRRAILLEGLAWTHGLGAACAAQFHSLWSNKDQSEMVLPMLAEFQSHRVHYHSLVHVAQPSIFTRVLILGTALLVLPVQFVVCLVYAPACHSVARFVNSFATSFYTEALKAMDYGKMDVLMRQFAPPIAKTFYGLAPNATFRDVLLNVRADDAFHTHFNEICCECHCNNPVQNLAPTLPGASGGGGAGGGVVVGGITSLLPGGMAEKSIQ